ncbi:MAG: hypothetical protein VZR36_08985 [Prevotella sp.]|nr:hypothetical protein [Prevotella sp.]
MEIDKLFRDLSSRVPYGVIGKVSIDVTTKDIDMEGFHIDEPMDVDVILTDINIDGYIKFMAVDGSSDDLAYTIQEWSELGVFTYKDFKPYLRTKDDFTEEEKRQFELLTKYYAPNNYGVMDWFNEHHIDYRGLIGDGTANKAPDGMYSN